MRWITALGPILLGLGAHVTAKNQPEVKFSEFTSRPQLISFFEDSETALVLDENALTVLRTENAGQDWVKVNGPQEGKAMGVFLHPQDSRLAVIVGEELTHWITEDQGKQWRAFNTESIASMDQPIAFHWADPKRILFNAADECRFLAGCSGKTYYTLDGFASTPQLLHGHRRTCYWAKSTDLFTTGVKREDHDRTLCIVQGKFTDFQRDYRLMISDDFFKTSHEPAIASGRTVPGVINIATVKGFIVVAAKARGSKEMALYVTRNTRTWHRAEFGVENRIFQDAYTVLESTNHSIQIMVTPNTNIFMGVLLSSNSNGTYFTTLSRYVSRSNYGYTDFEKLVNIQGIFIINQVSNGAAIDRGQDDHKVLETKITFDDGRTFNSIKSGNDELHLHSVTELRNTGRVFSSLAPGILMGNGNTGEKLIYYRKASLFISDDAGKTWIPSPLKGPQKYEFGDQGSILLAVSELGYAAEMSYSLNHGKKWTTFKLEKKIQVFELTTIPDSTSLKFIMTGTDEAGKFFSVAIDFDGLHERKCKDDDFEDWYARKDDKGEPRCLMGHKQYFRRRKPDADCFIQTEFKETVAISAPCDCTDADFECDFNFKEYPQGQCLPVGLIRDTDQQCKSREGTFKASSGWRLIPGNDCKRVGKQKDDLIDRPCSEAFKDPANGKVSSTVNTIAGERWTAMHYLERDTVAEGDDETVVALTDAAIPYLSHDHGKTWKPALDDENAKVMAIYPHPYNSDYVYFITASERVYYSKNRGLNVHRFKAPDVPNRRDVPVLSFHHEHPDWLIWTGNQDCSKHNGNNCHVEAHVSRKNGEGGWELLLPWVKRCQFIYREHRPESENLIYCEHWQKEDLNGPLQLLASTDDFSHKQSLFQDIVAFATMAEFIVVAAKTEDKKFLSAQTSVDGETFAHAAFPLNYHVEHQTAYTVLDSQTNAIFLHVTQSSTENGEYGSILKSNSNGTSYVMSINNVNRNRAGYVDWEKMRGLEGVALVNVVDNVDEISRGSVGKKLKTMITHDDGAFWAYLPCPEKDYEGHPYGCDAKNLHKKSLHLHGYTEREDPSQTFSSPSAVGLMIGIGNVGEALGPANDGDTFLTKDGGITWKVIQKGAYMWEYGDQGSIIVLLKRGSVTGDIVYSLNDGEDWHTYQFDASNTFTPQRLTTVPSDNSRNFLIWGELEGSLATVNIDFTGLTDKPCKLDKEHPNAADSDYELWSPIHPHKVKDPECLFGHVSQYYRKKLASTCYNGPRIDRLHNISRNCSCTKEDFECDFNFEPTNNAEKRCKLVPGFTPRAGLEQCKANPLLVEYYGPTGYRRIPLSTCQGGLELDQVGTPQPCPGHKEQYEQRHSLRGIGLFLAIIIPLAAAAGVGYYVRNKWDGKFGRIRLGGEDAANGGRYYNIFSHDKPWIAWPVAVVSGFVAVLAATPLLVSSLWRSLMSRFGRGHGSGYAGPTFTSRNSFAQPRGNYEHIDHDEGEFLGEDSDEDA